MARFLIEIPHEAEMVACARAIHVLMTSGSHFLTNADYGCKDGDHRAWIIVDVDDREEARRLLPPLYRSQARIVGLNKFSLEQIEELLAHHPPAARSAPAR
jgi:hypothetical protein